MHSKPFDLVMETSNNAATLPVQDRQHAPISQQELVQKDEALHLHLKTSYCLWKLSKFGDSTESNNSNSKKFEDLRPFLKRMKMENSCLVAPITQIKNHCDSKTGTGDDANEITSDNLQCNSRFASTKELVVEVQMTTNHDNETKLLNPRKNGVSLAEFLTKDQMKEHISSLRQRADKDFSDNMKESNENMCQLCGLNVLRLRPKLINCSYCAVRIKRKANYYYTPEGSHFQYYFCTICYKRTSQGGNISIHDIRIPKEKLKRRTNNLEIEESWVQCDKCGYWQHQVCGLFYDDHEGKTEYKCPICWLRETEKEDHYEALSTFSAKNLPQTKLSNHIEERLFRRLKQERRERAKVEAKCFDEVPGAENLSVRVVLSMKKKLTVKQKLLDTLKDQDYSAEFPYTSKLILLFQKIEGVDVCIFSMYVQEFGIECSPPNQRCVYISYIDSIKYFTPTICTSTGEALRSFVFHEILIGYLDYAKKRGFTTCYLWACPPSKGDDFFFYCHPETQKSPKSDLLRQWYYSMLRKATNEGIVVNRSNLYDHFLSPTGEGEANCKKTLARLPYFDGDYWSGASEEFIKNVEKELSKENNATKRTTKATLKAMQLTNSSDVLLLQKVREAISRIKQDLMVICLQFVCTICREPILSRKRWFCNQCENFHICERCHDLEQELYPNDTHTSVERVQHVLSQVLVDVPFDTEDEDDMLDNSVFENRNKFLRFCQDNHYQFDSLRRAKHSSLMILRHLCDHIAPIMGNSIVSHGARSVVDLPEKLIIELLQLLQHVDECRSTKADHCSYKHCREMRSMLIHASMCRVRAIGGCITCEKVWYSLILHAKSCAQQDCQVPRCKELNAALKCKGSCH